jgi:poly(glycerol-phosphate) alpha-glucosyltransferase
MPQITMPEGKYFSLSQMVRATSGGQTRALLMRNRLLAQRSGIEPTIVTFDGWSRYAQIRAELREQGQLVDPMRLLNIFEWYRDHGVDDVEAIGAALPDVENCDAVDEAHPDGTVHRTLYRNARTGQAAVHDYRRPDGTVYARVGVRHAGEPTPVTLVNTDGFPVAHWPDEAGWHQHWIRGLTPPDTRAFIISDSRYELVNILGLQGDQFHIIHLIHNIHVGRPRRWSSPVKATYLPMMAAISQLDGLVTLTNRQRKDLAVRYGATNNLYVVPNPVESPQHPDPLPAREAKRFVIVSRFEPQKQLEHAIQVFALVLKEEPEATLDIYGDGSTRSVIEAEIANLGLEKSVTLHGFNPRARETLWTATGFLMTSKFEGYPLASLEAMSHGCPVISYDIKYGPREQITHGVDGFLVKRGGRQEMADRVVELIRNPELVAKMGAAGFDKALQHDSRAFLEDWRTVLEAVVAAKEHRTTIESVTLTVTRLGSPWLPGRFPGDRIIGRQSRSRSSSPTWRGRGRVKFVARLDVDGHSQVATLDSAVLSLEAVDSDSAPIRAVPLKVHRSGTTFELAATINLTSAFRGMGEATRSMRLRLAWENSSWQAPLPPPAADHVW